MPRTLPLEIAVTTKFQVQGFAMNEISSHSQSLPTLPVATFHDGETIILDVGLMPAFVIVNLLERTGTPEPKSISVSVREKLPLHHGIFIVVVDPAPLAVTPAPVKLSVVTAVERVEPSSCVVSDPPPHVLAIVSCRVAPVPDGVIVILVPATSSASVCARLAELKSDTAVLGIEIATLDIAVTSPFALTVGDATCVALPKVPTFELTVARVRAVAPVASPV